MACARFELKKLFLTPNEVRDRGDYVPRSHPSTGIAPSDLIVGESRTLVTRTASQASKLLILIAALINRLRDAHAARKGGHEHREIVPT